MAYGAAGRQGKKSAASQLGSALTAVPANKRGRLTPAAHARRLMGKRLWTASARRSVLSGEGKFALQGEIVPYRALGRGYANRVPKPGKEESMFQMLLT